LNLAVSLVPAYQKLISRKASQGTFDDISEIKNLFAEDNDVYHIGASLKDPGRKWVAFSKMGLDANVLLQNILP
jgi:hypothetical protein